MAAFWYRVTAGSGGCQRTVLPAESPIRDSRIQVQQHVTFAYGFIGTAGRLPWVRAAEYPPAGRGLSIERIASRFTHPTGLLQTETDG